VFVVFHCRFTCGELTFAEAYRKTGRIFCVTLSSTTKKAPPVLLNYLTAPDVTIASAVIASAAVPGFVQPVRLQYSKCSIHSNGQGPNARVQPLCHLLYRGKTVHLKHSNIIICPFGSTEDSKGVVKSQAGETYFDGSIEQDIPVAGLAEMFNCQFFIACQCNPHVVPFFFNRFVAMNGWIDRCLRWRPAEYAAAKSLYVPFSISSCSTAKEE